MELKCPKCGIHHRREDLFCSKCGTRLGPDDTNPLPDDSFLTDALNLLGALSDFRAWIDQRKKTNARFMKAYKKRIDDIGPGIEQFKRKYGNSESGRLRQFELVQDIFACPPAMLKVFVPVQQLTVHHHPPRSAAVLSCFAVSQVEGSR